MICTDLQADRFTKEWVNVPCRLDQPADLLDCWDPETSALSVTSMCFMCLDSIALHGSSSDLPGHGKLDATCMAQACAWAARGPQSSYTQLIGSADPCP